MFDWINRVFRRVEDPERAAFLSTIDAMNARAGGGPPVSARVCAGTLSVPSGQLLLGDPQCVAQCQVEFGAPCELAITLSVHRYPNGNSRVNELLLSVVGAEPPVETREIGGMGIDSAKVVVVDREDYRLHWTYTGPDRIGEIVVMKDERCLKLLTRKYKLTITHRDWYTAYVREPISLELEAEIEAYLKTIPEYAKYTFMHFRVSTNNSFDRVNFHNEQWGFLPVGNAPEPLLFTCGTGRGDGSYRVMGGFSGSQLVEVRVDFMAE
jgi:hypothetical protein